MRPVSDIRDPNDLFAADAAREAQAERDKQRRLQEIADFKWLASHEQGRRFLLRLLSMSGQFRTSMTGNSHTFFNEGMRNFGLMLIAEFNEHSLKAYVKMLEEAKANE